MKKREGGGAKPVGGFAKKIEIGTQAFFINLKYLGLEGPAPPGRPGQPLPRAKYENAFFTKKGLDHETPFGGNNNRQFDESE
jgi:hypothetical protein